MEKELVREGAVTAGEIVKYLQGYPEDSEVLLAVLDTTGERKYVLPVTDFAFITDEKRPFVIIVVDPEKREDVTDDHKEENA